ncbi:MAG: YlxR family protein [Chloroflexi bacterium]|nr:YlxR family protein [Chloroflexota bacterium]
MSPQKSLKQKHVPMRTCVACRQERPKRELVRIVRSLSGAVVVDPKGKQAGRGAYLCRARPCWELALKKQALEHALQTAISPEDRAALAEFAQGLPEALASDSGLGTKHNTVGL